MAVISIKNKTKSGSLLVGNAPFIPSDYESIATVTVGGGGAANVEFTSIPSTYQHLQVRIMSRDNRATLVTNNLFMYINGDTTTNYSYHLLGANGSSAFSDNGVTTDLMIAGTSASTGASSSVMGISVLDILDYKDTNKNKTTRVLTGLDDNSSGVMRFWSGNWRSTAAITSLKFYASTSANLSQYSSFALYGIKG
jgi:hypothetical protein